MTDDDRVGFPESLTELVAELQANETPMTVVLRPTSAFMLASLLQLALRHPEVDAGSIAPIARTFIEHVRQFFQMTAPTAYELLRRGDDPAFDVPTTNGAASRISASVAWQQMTDGALMLTPSQRMALADILLTTLQTPGHAEVHVDVVRNVETTPEELLALMIEPIAPEDPRLYDAAREACHYHGLPWTDPRTGETHLPPKTVTVELPATPDWITDLRAAVTDGAGHECDEWRVRGACLLCGARDVKPFTFRLRYRIRGGHVICRAFTAPSPIDTFAKCGELVFSIQEWPAVRVLLAPVAELLPEDE